MRAAKPAAERAAPALPPMPYPGLRPFEKHEWSIFFGRERMVDEVLDRLAEHRLVVVHGSSGCGKSSLIRAGVLPRLEREYARHGLAWRTATLRPGGAPLWNFADALARLAGGVGDADHPVHRADARDPPLFEPWPRQLALANGGGFRRQRR